MTVGPPAPREAHRSGQRVDTADTDRRALGSFEAVLGAWLGGPVTHVADATPPWASGTRTDLLALASGDRLVLQRSRDRRAIGRRLRVGRKLPAVAPALPIPAVLAGDAESAEPFLLTRAVEGTSGRALLGDDGSAAVLGARMGELAAALRRVPARGFRLSSLWADAERLARAGQRWVDESRAILGPSGSAALDHLLERVPAELGGDRSADAPLAGDRPAFAHGDLAPVNVLFREGVIVAVLDLERARVAHPLFDAAWWRWIIRYHHPERWGAAGPAFFAAAGVELNRPTIARLDLLAALQLLERLHQAARRPAERAVWAARLGLALDAVDRPAE